MRALQKSAVELSHIGVCSVFLFILPLLMCLNHQEEISDRFVLVTLGYRHINDLKSFTLHTDNLMFKGKRKGHTRPETKNYFQFQMINILILKLLFQKMKLVLFYSVLNGNKTTSSGKTKSVPKFFLYLLSCMWHSTYKR